MGILDKLGDYVTGFSEAPGSNIPAGPSTGGPPGRNYTNGGPPGSGYTTTPAVTPSATKPASNVFVDRGSKAADQGGGNPAPQVAEGPSASDTLASISRDELKNYLDTYGKTEEELLADTNSTALIDGAKESQALGQQVSAGMQQRTLGRYGASMTPAQQAAQQRMGSLGNAASYTGAVNNAAVDQRDRNFGLKSALMGMGKEQLSVAMGGLGSAAGMEASREAEYQRAKASAHTSNMNMLGTIIGFGM